jgi:hypothetical protein
LGRFSIAALQIKHHSKERADGEVADGRCALSDACELGNSLLVANGLKFWPLLYL